jgi:hypothetical protein
MNSFRRLSSISAAALVIAGLACSSGARADQVIPDDLIVQGSTCVGLDCVNNEVFGFGTVVLKENNTRIFFLDTSVGAGFPANTWSIVANDSANGGQNYLGFEDNGALNSGVAVRSFKVMAGARADALVVDKTGNVGIGKANPLLMLHMVKGDTPGVRLDQDGTGGFTPQVWDVAGNEANFFIRDVTGGSRLPFRIRPGAPTSSIDIAATGFVGIGTATPAANLHVRSGTNPTIELESTAGTGTKWTISATGANGLFGIKDLVANTVPFKVAPAAPTNSFVVRADGSLQISALPNCTNGIRTNAAGVVSCMPAAGPAPDRAAVASRAPGVTLASYNTSNTTAGGNGGGGTSSAGAAAGTNETAAGCSDGDIAGSWSMFGTNIEEGSANSVLWCDVQFSKSGKAPAKYSIEGVCRSHATNAAAPQNYVVSGDRSISVTPACKFSGNFSLKQGATAVTATILEGRIEGEGANKSRAVGVSRWPRGKAFALQTFTMQR